MVRDLERALGQRIIAELKAVIKHEFAALTFEEHTGLEPTGPEPIYRGYRGIGSW